jgi:hypothetical protein
MGTAGFFFVDGVAGKPRNWPGWMATFRHDSDFLFDPAYGRRTLTIIP